MEGITHATKAKRGACYVLNSRTAEMQAVCVINKGPKCGSMKFPLDGMPWFKHMLSSGVAVNMFGKSNEAIKAMGRGGLSCTTSMLAFPVPSVHSSARERTALVHLVDKDDGRACFTSADEMTVAGSLPILGFVLEYYPSSPLTWDFDPTPLHHARLFVPQKSSRAPPYPRFLDDDRSSMSLPRQLIYRTSHPELNQWISHLYTRDPSTAIASAPILPVEMDRHECVLMSIEKYISKLEECWRDSVELNCEYLVERSATAKRLVALQERIMTRSDPPAALKGPHRKVAIEDDTGGSDVPWGPSTSTTFQKSDTP
eukprot:Sspe_Gene.28833::Locus_13273_Transcript_1_1_Confidence_1.000_Length_1555::g.28833::m.28833